MNHQDKSIRNDSRECFCRMKIYLTEVQNILKSNDNSIRIKFYVTIAFKIDLLLRNNTKQIYEIAFAVVPDCAIE